MRLNAELNDLPADSRHIDFLNQEVIAIFNVETDSSKLNLTNFANVQYRLFNLL